MSGGRRRVLLLLPFVPRLDGHHGGSRAIAQLVMALGERCDVGAICVRMRDDPPADDRVRGSCAFFDEVHRDAMPLPSRLVREARARLEAFGVAPAWVARWHVPALEAKARERIREWQPDVVQIEFHVMGQYAAALRAGRTPIVLTQHESATAAARERAAQATGRARSRAVREARAWERYERKVLGTLDAVVAFSERDRAAVAAMAPGIRVACIPLGGFVPERASSAVGNAPGRLLFIGNFGHPPNVDSMHRLVAEILPAVRRRVPSATLQVIGRGAPPLPRAASRDGVIIVGEVEDVAPYLDDAAVVVVPARLGGGTRVKVLEALAAGKAVVATPRAIEGIAIEPGVHAVVAESDAALADAIAALLEDAPRRAALGAAARRWAEAHLGWGRVGEAYEALYEQLLAERR